MSVELNLPAYRNRGPLLRFEGTLVGEVPTFPPRKSGIVNLEKISGYKEQGYPIKIIYQAPVREASLVE